MKAYKDIDKNAKDLLNKDFVLGAIHFSHKRKVDTVEINTSGKILQDNNQIQTSVEGKFKLPKYGFSITENVDSKKVLISDLCIENYFYKGLKQNLTLNYNAETNANKISFTNSYQNPSFNMALNLNNPFSARDIVKSLVYGNLSFQFYSFRIVSRFQLKNRLIFSGPRINFAKLYRYKGYIFGTDIAIDTKNVALSRLNLAVGYETKGLSIFGFADNFGRLFRASLYQDIDSRISAAAQVGWKYEKNVFNWCIGMRYLLDKDNLHTLKVKVDDSKNVTFGLVSKLSNEVKLHATTSISKPAQIGLGVTIET